MGIVGVRKLETWVQSQQLLLLSQPRLSHNVALRGEGRVVSLQSNRSRENRLKSSFRTLFVCN